ncbi:dermonecrotic toxin domain-containing protein [Pseudomonas sp. P2757]|uniref:dermonecrotic toxin domain-containing protein n=1 Tax=unclassified Pseudomonas TaxID=196821 RepID=UPI003B5A2C71
MTESLLFDFPPPARDLLSGLPGAAAFAAPVDEHLLHVAATNRRASSEGLRQLCAGAPSVRQTLNRLLREQLDLDGQQAGLLFHPVSGHAQRFVSLADACALVFQQPVLEEWLDRQCQVTGIHPSHALRQLRPLQLLDRLKTLAPAQALEQRWNAYWDARSPGTPLSRREHAAQLYREHIEAVAQMAFARRQLTAGQLQPLWSLLDPVPAAQTAAETLKFELPNLLLNNGARARLAAAWVISRGDDAGAQLLYLPSRPDAMHAFARRSDLQAWLTSQPLIPLGVPEVNLQVEYGATDGALNTPFNEWLWQQQMAQVGALRNGSAARRTLAEHGMLALSVADQVDRQLGLAVFSTAPGLELGAANSTAEDDQPLLFDSLYADIPWSWRQAAVRRQREVLEAWLSAPGRTIAAFTALHSELEGAEQAANTAAHNLLAQDDTTCDRDFTALHQAHTAGLHAETGLQRMLGQISDEEAALLKALLESPDPPGTDRVAASLTLRMTGPAGDTSQTLSGPFLITHAQTLIDADAPHSVLLYWPGCGGGLQRFANRRVLASQVFKIDHHDRAIDLQLEKITGDPLRHSLTRLTADFKTSAETIRQRQSATDQAESLERLRKSALADLQVPVNAARSLVVKHLHEQERSTTLSNQLPDWLTRLNSTERSRLKSLIEAFVAAMKRSHELMEIKLIPRDDFTRQHLHARLRKDFALKEDVTLALTLPDSVTQQTRYSAGPSGTRRTTVMVPSTARSKMTLEALAQLNIDNQHAVQQDGLSQRLVFMRLEVAATDSGDRYKLLNGINLIYLRKILPELDLPKAYEKLILDTFKGAPDEAAFIQQHRRECLLEPWRLTLQLQGQRARLQGEFDDSDLQTLHIAMDAVTAQAWNPPGKRIVILPAYLSAGGKDTHAEGPSTLSGVTFIEEQLSGVTLLYLPDSPDERFLRRFSSLEDARRGLFNLCRQYTMIHYLARRTVHGNVRAHEHRLNHAVQRDFDGMIGVGERWPVSTSLAAQLLDAHLGRLIEAHRGSSRSNDALYVERYALQGPRAFNYIKMALGFVPFMGTAIALYDAWTAANQAVAAFLRGKVGDGLDELVSALLSVIDAAMDLIPGHAAASSVAPAARALTRTRQLGALSASASALQAASRRQAAQAVARFSGYEYQRPLSLSGLQPSTHGIYRNVYRHADGDFIVRQGRFFQVEWSKDSRNWRLTGTAGKTYKQPIALDEAGNWDTWFGVYGSAFEGGGLGGGGVLGHLANTLQPLWPEAIRARLPHWWTDRALRRHVQLTNTADSLMEQIRLQITRHDGQISRYINNTDDPLLRELADVACIGDIGLVRRRFQALTDLHPLTHGNKRRETIRFLSDSARIIADRYRHRIYYSSDRATRLQNQIDAMRAALDQLPPEAITQHLNDLQAIRTLRVESLRELEHIELLMRELNHWYERITTLTQRPELRLAADVATFNQRLTESNLLYLKTSHRMQIVRNYAHARELSWIYLQQQAYLPRADIHRALYVQHSLAQADISRVQRNQMLRECLATYAAFQQKMKAWTTSHPDYFHADVVAPLMAGIERMADKARATLDLPAAPRTAGQSNKKVFQTEDGQMLLGVEQWEPRTRKRQFALSEEGRSGEIWEQADNGKFRLRDSTPPESAPKDLARLVTDARKRLGAQSKYLADVHAYAEQHMLPVDLEHMLSVEADDLTRRARDIEALASHDPIIKLLREKAAELRKTGRQLRTRQTLRTHTPTDGMLLDLIGQQAVEIRKRAPLKALGKRADGRFDYLQEYEIWNLTQEPAQLLWYAHFHYSKAAPRFGDFEKAHLKLPEHRALTHADNPDLPYADIGKSSAVLAFFEER